MYYFEHPLTPNIPTTCTPRIIAIDIPPNPGVWTTSRSNSCSYCHYCHSCHQTLHACLHALARQLLPIMPTTATKPTTAATANDTPRQWNLSYKQMRFAQLLFAGSTQSDAYRGAGYNPPLGSKSIWESAARLSSHVKVQRYLSHLSVLSARTERSATLSRQRKRELLCDAAHDAPKWSERLTAIVIDNRMTGDDAPIRIEGEITLAGILDGIESSVGLPPPSVAALPQSDPAAADAVIDVEATPTG